MITYGVIVGRFQVPNLHSGHLELFRQVSERHERVIVFVGVPRTVPTKRNPLDFEARKKMIQAEYPDFTILPLRDEKTDQHWSNNLDLKIAEVTNFTSHVTLYGGRDSFVPHYFGSHPVLQLEIPAPVCGTDIREKLSNRVMQSPDFRAGIIYSVYNQYPRAIPTVDVAILRNGAHGVEILLGKKPGEHNYRFVGGFCEPGQSFERNAQREAYEESLIDVTELEFIGTYPIEDWRYKSETDAKITTTFFAGWTQTSRAVSGDDIAEVKWFALTTDDGKVLDVELEGEHEKILKPALRLWVAKKGLL